MGAHQRQSPNCDSGRTKLAQQLEPQLLRWRNYLAISCFILVICLILGILLVVSSTGTVTFPSIGCAEAEAELQSCQKENDGLKEELRTSKVKRERIEDWCDRKLYDARSSCSDGWLWYIVSIMLGIVIVVFSLVIVIRDLQAQCRGLQKENCTLKEEKGALNKKCSDQDKVIGTLRERINDLQEELKKEKDKKPTKVEEKPNPPKPWFWRRLFG